MVNKTHLLRDSVINGRMADPQNYTHGYNTRSKNTGAKSLKAVDGAIIAASPLQSGLSPFVTPFTRSPVTTTTQTTAQSFFHSVVSYLFATPKLKVQLPLQQLVLRYLQHPPVCLRRSSSSYQPFPKRGQRQG